MNRFPPGHWVFDRAVEHEVKTAVIAVFFQPQFEHAFINEVARLEAQVAVKRAGACYRMGSAAELGVY